MSTVPVGGAVARKRSGFALWPAECIVLSLNLFLSDCGRQLLHLQGIQLGSDATDRLTESQLTNLAGNALSGQTLFKICMTQTHDSTHDWTHNLLNFQVSSFNL